MYDFTRNPEYYQNAKQKPKKGDLVETPSGAKLTIDMTRVGSVLCVVGLVPYRASQLKLIKAL